MCPNTEFFLVHIFPHSDRIRRDTSYLCIFSPNAGKYGPEKTPYLDTFHAVYIQHFADDANIIYRNKSLRNINQRVNSIYIVEWLRANRIALNTDKSKIVLFRTPRKPLTKKNEF